MLKAFLDEIEGRYQKKSFLFSDPVEFLHRFKDPHDQEAVGLLASALAYGRVKSIRASIESALSCMQANKLSPSQFVRSLSNKTALRKAEFRFRSFVHRFNSGSDVLTLLQLLNKSWEKTGSLGQQFNELHPPEAETIEESLALTLECWKDWAKSTGASPSFYYFLSSPRNASCCKRWCLFLRWMLREDAIDIGVWQAGRGLLKKQSRTAQTKNLGPRHLVMPLDTHTGFISKELALTQRKSLNWKAALEVTQSLRRLDPKDPIRYDFALCRIGILDHWKAWQLNGA